jgi:hypothetical protein
LQHRKYPDETLENVRLKHLKHDIARMPATPTYLVENCSIPLLDEGQGLGGDGMEAAAKASSSTAMAAHTAPGFGTAM